MSEIMQRSNAHHAPSFEEASTPRQKAFAAGFDPAYWYAVELDSKIAKGQRIEVRFQGISVAVFRGQDGKLGAIENRCPHRQVKLSDGDVKGCALACKYHGWAFDTEGKLVAGGQHFQEKGLPNLRLRRYPVEVKYGLVFVFFGDPALASERPLPTIPVLEGPNPWLAIPIEYQMRCHPTAYVNNVMDSTHVPALHTKLNTRSMIYGPVTRCEAEGDSVVVSHSIELDPTGLLKYLVGTIEQPTQDAYYEYPYLHVHVGGVLELWNFMLPVDGEVTKLFLLSCSKGIQIPGLDVTPPKALLDPFLAIAKRILVKPLFDEDVWSTEAEQKGYEEHFATPAIEPHPPIRLCYQLTIRKWEEYLARQGQASRTIAPEAPAADEAAE